MTYFCTDYFDDVAPPVLLEAGADYTDDVAPPVLLGCWEPFLGGSLVLGKNLGGITVACLLIPVESCSCCRGCCSCFSPPRSSSVRDAIVRPYDD